MNVHHSSQGAVNMRDAQGSLRPTMVRQLVLEVINSLSVHPRTALCLHCTAQC